MINKNEDINKVRRVHMIDTIRGIIIIGVVVYHTLFDLYDLFDYDLYWMESAFADFIRDFGAGVLIFISGISSLLSRNNIKRGIKTIICALILSLVTYYFVENNFIFIGILHFLGVSMLMYGLVFRYINKLPRIPTAIILFVIFVLTYNVSNGYFGIKGICEIGVPVWMRDSTFDYIMGFDGGNIFSADYYPFIPWTFLFLCGTLIGNYVKEGKIPEFLYKNICPPITYIGRKTLIIYLLHQPIIYGLLLAYSHIKK